MDAGNVPNDARAASVATNIHQHPSIVLISAPTGTTTTSMCCRNSSGRTQPITVSSNYGQLIKLRESGRVVGKIRRIVFGNPACDDIETTDVEKFNGISRERVGCIVRRTKCYAKNRNRLSNAIGLFQFYWNSMHEPNEKLTPAIEGHRNKKMDVGKPITP